MLSFNRRICRKDCLLVNFCIHANIEHSIGGDFFYHQVYTTLHVVVMYTSPFNKRYSLGIALYWSFGQNNWIVIFDIVIILGC